MYIKIIELQVFNIYYLETEVSTCKQCPYFLIVDKSSQIEFYIFLLLLFKLRTQVKYIFYPTGHMLSLYNKISIKFN